MNRRILAFALLTVFVVVLVGCGGNTREEAAIKGTIKSFYAAYNADDWDTCLTYIDDTNNVGSSTIESELQMAKAASGNVTVDKVTKISVTGSTAKADVTMSFSDDSATDGHPLTNEHPLVQINGRWRITWEE